MENKKKYHGMSKLLFLLLFILLLGTSSTCFANSEVFTEIDTISPFIMEQIIEKIDNASSLYQNSSTAISNFNSFKNNYDIEQVCSTFNNFFADKSIDYFENCSMLITIYDSKFTLRVAQNNNTHHETYPFIKIWARSSTETDFEYVDSNGNAVNNKPYYMVSFNTNGTLSFNSTTAPYSRISEVYGQSPTFVNSIVNCPYFISFNSIQNSVCYYKNGNNAGFWGFVDNIVLLSEPEPEEPSGDSGRLGYITNPSGENGGSINLEPINQSLNNIQNQISGDTQKVIENQNNNTQTIVNAISGEVGKINNTLTNNADETIDNTEITSGDIAGTVDFSIIENNENYSAYTNFWYNLTTGFSNSMTNVVRTLPVEFRNENYIINLDDFTVFIPTELKIFLGIISSVFVCLYITRESKHIVEDIQTASIDNVANKLTEDFETNMF